MVTSMPNEAEKLKLILPFAFEIGSKENIVKLVLWSSSPKEKVITELAEALNPLGALFSYLNVFPDETSSNLGSFIWYSFMRYSSKREIFEAALRETLEKMKRERIIKNYYYLFPSKEGFFIDHNVYSIEDISGDNLYIYTKENLSGLFLIPRKKYGSKNGGILINELGEMYGKAIGEKMRNICLEAGIKACLELLHASGSARGIVHQKSIEFFKDREGWIFKIILDRVSEEEILLENGIKECGTHQTGVYRGFLSEILGKELPDDAVEEVRCLSMGEPESVFYIKLPRDIKV